MADEQQNQIDRLKKLGRAFLSKQYMPVKVIITLLAGIVFSPLYSIYVIFSGLNVIQSGADNVKILGININMAKIFGFYQRILNIMNEEDVKAQGKVLSSVFRVGIGLGVVFIGLLSLKFTLVPFALSVVLPEIMLLLTAGMKVCLNVFVSSLLMLHGAMKIPKYVYRSFQPANQNKSQEPQVVHGPINKSQSGPEIKRRKSF